MGYLEAVMGERTVPVEKGEHYLHPEWRTALVPFATFWRAAQASNTAAAVPATACTGGARVAQSGRSCGDAPVSETAGAPQAGGAAVAADVRAQSAGPTYLAQHQLFEQVPALRRDIMVRRRRRHTARKQAFCFFCFFLPAPDGGRVVRKHNAEQPLAAAVRSGLSAARCADARVLRAG